MNYIIPFLFLYSLFNYSNEEVVYQTIKSNPTQEHEGKKLMETHCYLCHSQKAPENKGRIAPPMIAIKEHYLKVTSNKAEFVAAIKSFVDHPADDKVQLKGDLEKFGLMPKQDYPKGSIEKIADFMYDYQIEAPSWFKSHWEAQGNLNWKQSGKQYTEVNKQKSYSDIGLEYALETKKVLGKNLMGAIQTKGTVAALSFCNERAIPLTDSMAVKYKANIKRVSDKNRNPRNVANKEELKYIKQFQSAIASQSTIAPVVVEKGNKVHFYYPIDTNTMCLQCHGNSTQISSEVKHKILKLYPKDLAIGYSESQLRGIWSITFEK